MQTRSTAHDPAPKSTASLWGEGGATASQSVCWTPLAPTVRAGCAGIHKSACQPLLKTPLYIHVSTLSSLREVWWITERVHRDRIVPTAGGVQTNQCTTQHAAPGRAQWQAAAAAGGRPERQRGHRAHHQRLLSAELLQPAPRTARPVSNMLQQLRTDTLSEPESGGAERRHRIRGLRGVPSPEAGGGREPAGGGREEIAACGAETPACARAERVRMRGCGQRMCG